MKTELPNLLGAVIRDYFTDHLPRLRGTSPHTIHSYRDSIVLLLRFLSRQRNKPASADSRSIFSSPTFPVSCLRSRA